MLSVVPALALQSAAMAVAAAASGPSVQFGLGGGSACSELWVRELKAGREAVDGLNNALLLLLLQPWKHNVMVLIIDY